MPWTCQLVPHAVFEERCRRLHSGETHPDDRYAAAHELFGMMWEISEREQDAILAGAAYERRPTPQYLQEHRAKRRILMICLPSSPETAGYSVWSPDCYSGTARWDVQGEPPKLTAHPSINAEDTYHGWLENGVLSADVDGRKF